MAEKWGYLEEKAAEDAPVSDNPSGMYCPECRQTGLKHCSQPEYCSGMRRMKSKPLKIQGSQEKDSMDYDTAMRALNKAAYEASRAALMPDAPTNIDRQSLRLIARETDRLVDYMENSGDHPSHIEAVVL